MYCTNCGAAVPLKEQESARTCYACGEILYRAHEEASNVTPIFAGSEAPEPSDIDRHPAASGSKKRLGPPEFFYFGVYNMGKRAHYWVRSSAKTPARKSLRRWLKGQGVVITDNLGNRIDLLEDRVDRGKAYDEAIPVMGGPITTLPDGVRGYLDAYAELRDHPVWRPL